MCLENERYSNNAKINQYLLLPTHYFLRPRGLTFEAFAFEDTLAFFNVGGLSMTSISEPTLAEDALRLPGCLLPTDDRSISGGSSDLDVDPRVSDCCVGLCSRDDPAD